MKLIYLEPILKPDRKVAQHHWGGGTPTHLKPDEINDLASYINKSVLSLLIS